MKKLKCKHGGTYNSNIIIHMPSHWITAKKRFFNVDVCIANEIINLTFNHGIRTIECCCGHGLQDGYIAVDENSILTMWALGYVKGIDAHGHFRSNLFKIQKEKIKHYA